MNKESMPKFNYNKDGSIENRLCYQCKKRYTDDKFTYICNVCKSHHSVNYCAADYLGANRKI